MDEDYEITEHLTSEQIFRSISLMCSQQIRFVAEIGRIKESLSRTLPRSEDCEDVPRNQQAIDLCFRDKIIALLMDRDKMEERVAVLEEKVQRLDMLIRRFRKLRSSLAAKEGGGQS